ncbi:UV excision repair protein RAD23 [Carpediemonas membranifera]|uniref:UV excision repair protein RAD23 n=1 Tax=Carpediemonas membranifera TaxID=201153 RepID=A0A8J6BCN8_9EUKA|nr:UV excision repair protein RAD23 [Carpediemonas membranifera]|eukprot:KAG9394677.1 UV excision repair protein RAD23 [Carpediemonas membranifera]
MPTETLRAQEVTIQGYKFLITVSRKNKADSSLQITVTGDYPDAMYHIVLQDQTIQILRQARTFHTDQALYTYLVTSIQMKGIPKKRKYGYDFSSVSFYLNKVKFEHGRPDTAASPPLSRSSSMSVAPQHQPAPSTSSFAPAPYTVSAAVSSAMPTSPLHTRTVLSASDLYPAPAAMGMGSPSPSDRLSRVEAALSAAMDRIQRLEAEGATATMQTLGGEVDVLKSMMLSGKRDDILKVQLTQSLHDRMGKLEGEVTRGLQQLNARVESLEKLVKARRSDMGKYM